MGSSLAAGTTTRGSVWPIAFARLIGRLLRQHPLEVEQDLLRFLAVQLRLEDQADALLNRYATRRQTSAQHADEIRCYLGVCPFGTLKREELRTYLREEAAHLERPSCSTAAMALSSR